MLGACQTRARVRQEGWLVLICKGRGGGTPVHVTFQVGRPWVKGVSTRVLGLLLQDSFRSRVGAEMRGPAEDKLEWADPADMPAPPILPSLSLTSALKDQQARPHRGLPRHWAQWPLCAVLQ